MQLLLFTNDSACTLGERHRHSQQCHDIVQDLSYNASIPKHFEASIYCKFVFLHLVSMVQCVQAAPMVHDTNIFIIAHSLQGDYGDVLTWKLNGKHMIKCLLNPWLDA